VDDEGNAAWSFDDRIRVINFALRQGRTLQFAGENNSDNSENNSDSELFGDDKSALEAVGE